MKAIDKFDPFIILQAVVSRVREGYFKELTFEIKNTMFHYFIGTRRYDIINYLITNGYDLSVKNRRADTPIHVLFEVIRSCATINNKSPDVCPSFKTLQLLVDNNADFNKQNGFKENALEILGIINDEKYKDKDFVVFTSLEATNTGPSKVSVHFNPKKSVPILHMLAFLYSKNVINFPEEEMIQQLGDKEKDIYASKKEELMNTSLGLICS